MSTVTTEEAVVDGVNKQLFIGGSRFVICYIDTVS